MTREPTARARWRATCPKCGEYAKPGRKRCALCRTALYPSDAFLAALKAPREDARRLVDVLAEDFDAPGWRDALDSPGASWNR